MVNIPLECEMVDIIGIPIRSKPTPPHVTIVIGPSSSRSKHLVLLQIFCVYPIMNGFAYLTPVANTSKCFFFGTSSTRHEQALSIFGALRCDVDHPIHCICSP